MSRLEASQAVYIARLEALNKTQEELIAVLKKQIALLEQRRSFFQWLFNRKTAA